jgi:hypothetical protein
LDRVPTFGARSYDVDELSLDRFLDRADHPHHVPAGHTERFILCQPTLALGLSQALYPSGEVLAMDPDVVAAVVPDRGALIEPSAQGTIGDADLFRQLAHPVEHREQARRADDDVMGEVDAVKRFCWVFHDTSRIAVFYL